jgi:hypothetical protein
MAHHFRVLTVDKLWETVRVALATAEVFTKQYAKTSCHETQTDGVSSSASSHQDDCRQDYCRNGLDKTDCHCIRMELQGSPCTSW